MKLTQKDKRLLKKSINHWNKDIIKNFEKGDIVLVSYDRIWQNKKTLVEDSSDFCSLCVEYYDQNYDQTTKTSCSNCPYYNFYHFKCTYYKGHWYKWNDKPTLKTATAMRDALQKILDSEVTK